MRLFDMLHRREQTGSAASGTPPGRPSPRDADSIAAPSVPRSEVLGLAGTSGSSSARSPIARLDRRLARAHLASAMPPAAIEPVQSRASVGSPDLVRDTEVRDEVLAHFHQLPSYQALLTVGPEAIYQLPPLLHDKLIALDCGARQARLVRATMSATEKLALDGTLKAVKGALRARGYGVLGDLVAEPHVLREILRNAGASGKGAAKGGPMQLFERWIALAVPTGATDLHIEVRRNVALVRIRVDGRIEPLPDGQGGRYSRKEVVDAIAAGYNSTRVDYDESQFV